MNETSTEQPVQTNRRVELTDKEKADLPLELKCCFFIEGWNHFAHITDVEDWAEQVGHLRFEYPTVQEDIDAAKNKAERLIEFVKSLC